MGECRLPHSRRERVSCVGGVAAKDQDRDDARCADTVLRSERDDAMAEHARSHASAVEERDGVPCVGGNVVGM